METNVPVSPPRPSGPTKIGDPNAPDHFGYPPGSGEGLASGQEQTDCAKELANKISWVLGSTYRLPYSNKKGPVYRFAQLAALAIIRAQGYSKSK